MPPAKKSTKAPVPDRIIDAMLSLAAEKGWVRLSLHEIADEAGVSLAQLHENYRSKPAILSACMARVDQQVLAGIGKPSKDETTRDRLFDVLMRRFDALNPHKEAIRGILRDLPRDPPLALFLACRGKGSMRWMLEGAGASCAGLFGKIQVKGLTAIYAATMRVWLNDDSEDMGKTMAFLDKRLIRAEGLMDRACSFGPFGRRKSETAEEAA
jgi:AcrR family transcriptional regulator